MNQPKFKIIKITQAHIDHQVATTEYTEDDFTLGKYDVEVTHVDGTKSYYGTYRTKTDAYECLKGMKKSKVLFRYGNQS